MALTRVFRHGYMTRRMFSAKIDYGNDDEYGNMDSSSLQFEVPRFSLENGTELQNIAVNYATFGKLNAQRDNALVVCHALTGNSSLDTWWGGLLGPECAFDTSKYFVVCANILGSCYGTTGPASINPSTGKVYGSQFPDVTVRDTVRLHMKLLQERLNVEQVVSAIGGSLGGMQALEWGMLGGDYVRSVVPIACGSHHTAWQIGISELQRQAIYMDPNYLGGNYSIENPPQQGLALARQIAMITYRTHEMYKRKYGRIREDSNLFRVQSYLDYQGQKFLSRFDVNSYVTLTKLMDSHDLGRDRGGLEAAMKMLEQPVLVLGIDSDVLYPISEQKELNDGLPNSKFSLINSLHGHDGFLLEQTQIGNAIQSFLNTISIK